MQKRTYKILDLVFIFSTLLLAIYLIWQFWPSKIKWLEQTGQKDNTDFKPAFIDKLTGVPSDNAADLDPKTIAVMIDNHPDAFPISGLNSAKIVYEAPVEGGMTRFMAIFSSVQEVDKVGPVRSARPDYFDWAKEYGIPLYLHCGGSPEALKILKTDRDIIDINEFYNAQYFWRDNSRLAPHNLYISSSLWQEILTLKKPADTSWLSFRFGENSTTSVGENLEIKYVNGWTIAWKYNKNVYERYFNDEKFLDDKEEPVTAQTIIIVKNKVKILDEIGRRAIYNIGTGEAFIFANGKVTIGTWKKTKSEFRTRFYDENGTELSVPPGKIWFMSVPEENEVKIF